LNIKVTKAAIYKSFSELITSIKILTKRTPLKSNLISNFIKDYLLGLKTLSKNHTKYKITTSLTNKSSYVLNKTEKQPKFLFAEPNKLNNIGKSFSKNCKLKTKLMNLKIFTVVVMEVNNVLYACVSHPIQS